MLKLLLHRKFSQNFELIVELKGKILWFSTSGFRIFANWQMLETLNFKNIRKILKADQSSGLRVSIQKQQVPPPDFAIYILEERNNGNTLPKTNIRYN